jgi:hypothetical protein
MGHLNARKRDTAAAKCTGFARVSFVIALPADEDLAVREDLQLPALDAEKSPLAANNVILASIKRSYRRKVKELLC